MTWVEDAVALAVGLATGPCRSRREAKGQPGFARSWPCPGPRGDRRNPLGDARHVAAWSMSLEKSVTIGKMRYPSGRMPPG
jgi:hypothetical protein